MIDLEVLLMGGPLDGSMPTIQMPCEVVKAGSEIHLSTSFGRQCYAMQDGPILRAIAAGATPEHLVIRAKHVRGL